MKTKKSPWVVYILECADGTFYTGSTNDIERRLSEHNEGKRGARYTKARRPIKLRHVESAKNRSAAQKREEQIKKLSRNEKLHIVQTNKDIHTK